MNQKIKKIGKAVAGSALLVGATLTGAASLTAAQNSGTSLGDYPQPFVGEDGTVQSTIVVGTNNAKVSDVVAAINVAGSLGNAAFSEKEVSTGGSAGTWSATNGATLDTQNDNLYFGNSINAVRETLTRQNVDVLNTTTAFTSNAEQDVTQYLYVGNQAVQYGNPGDTANEENPFLYVQNPSNVQIAEDGTATDNTGRLYKLQANFEDGMVLEKDGESQRNDDVYGEEVTMFGKTFTVADSSFTGDDQLVLYGSSQDVSLSYSGSTVSKTVTINGNEHTIELDGVNNNGVIYRVDGGSWKQEPEDHEFSIGDTTVRISDTINKKDDAGTATFSIGSQKVTLEDGKEVMLGEEENDVDGTMVDLSGSNINSNLDVSDGTDDGTIEVSSIEIAVGASDSDNNYVRAGEMFQDPVFDEVQFHFGGLNPNAASDGEEISISTSGDSEATVEFTEESGESVSQTFALTDGSPTDSTELTDGSDNTIHVREGATVSSDEYQTMEAGDFRHFLQVTDIETNDGSSPNWGNDADETVTVSFQNVVTGASYEVEFDDSSNGGTGVQNGDTEDEIIDGKTYTLAVQISGGSTVDGVTFDDNEAGTDVFTGLETENEATVHMTGPVDPGATNYENDGGSVNNQLDTATAVTWNLPTGSVDVWTEAPDSTTGDDDEEIDIDTDQDGTSEVSVAEGGSGTFSVGGVQYSVSDSSAEGTDTAIDPEQLAVTDQASTAITTPGIMVQEEEGDDETHDEYFVSVGHDGSVNDDRLEVGAAASGGNEVGQATYFTTTGASSLQSHEDDNDVASDYSMYGTYVWEDSGEAGQYKFMYPGSQSTAGAAYTGANGGVSSSGGASGDTITQMTPTGWPDAAALDSEVGQGMRQSQDLILVGGPSVNGLVSDLVSANKTMPASQYTQGQGMVQLVEDAFTNGEHALVVAGHSAPDTRAAAQYISNYADHSSELSGKDKVTVSTQTGQMVQ